jgi:aryl-alcohol dehydrogenase-like predicted oxidoreductase
VELGLGIIGLGKPWGHAPSQVPSERDAIDFLEFAFQSGIRYFDSAPSYGIAEERLGKFLRSLPHGERDQFVVATKFGERWDASRGEPFVDHSYDALCRSLDRSLQHLQRIDILQLHKTTPEALRSPDLDRAWEYARQAQIPLLGASVSDLESAAIVIANAHYSCIQLPLNSVNRKFCTSVEAAAARDMWLAINRPFAMGAMLYGDLPVSHEDAFRFVLQHRFRGVVLTGTRSPAHLQQNCAAFHQALSQTSGGRC